MNLINKFRAIPEPIAFREQTIVIAKDQPEYRPLPAFLFANDPEGKVVCCWQLSWRDRLRLLFNGGKLWHQIMTFNQALQPQLLTLDKPFTVADHAAALAAKAKSETLRAFQIAMGEKYGKKIAGMHLRANSRRYHANDRRRAIEFDTEDFKRAQELGILFLLGARITDANHHSAITGAPHSDAAP